jgi:hypothetical protein
MRYELAVALCVQIALIGFALAADDPFTNTSSLSGLIFDMGQSIQGNGFSNSYIDAGVHNLSLSSKGHGSGSYSYESLLGINDKAKYEDITGDYKASSERIIELKENTDFVYAPSSFYMGKSMKWGGFQSLGSEETCLKNYGTSLSMDAAFDQVSTLSKNISASLLLKSTESKDLTVPHTDVHGKSSLAVEAAFTGKGHIGALVPGDKQDADIFIDEDYLGTYSITKKMTDEFTYKLQQSEDEWLPCCSGGFASMNLMDQKPFKSAKGVFDCSCFKPLAVAEFPRT